MNFLPHFAALLTCAISLSAADINTLTPTEQKDGWKLLFDGKSLAGWRTYKDGGKIGAGWVVEDGLLKKQAKISGGDIMTEQPIPATADWELAWEWRIAEKGNNGVKYFITEARKGTLGHEYQLLDDNGHPDGKVGPHRQTASFYDVMPPAADKPMKPVGQWNHSRIVVKGSTVQHWLNNAKVLEYVLGSDAVKAAVAKSKFKNIGDFGTKVAGHILLTDHGDECSFRNVKLRIAR
jgi:hypothetical protein